MSRRNMQRLKPKDFLKWLRRKIARVYTHVYTHPQSPYSLIYSTCSSRQMPRKAYLHCGYPSSLSTRNSPKLTLWRRRVFLFFNFPLFSHILPALWCIWLWKVVSLDQDLVSELCGYYPRPSSPDLQLKTLRELTGQMQKSRISASVSEKPSLGPSGFYSSYAAFFEPEITMGIHLSHKVENKDLIKGITLGGTLAECEDLLMLASCSLCFIIPTRADSRLEEPTWASRFCKPALEEIKLLTVQKSKVPGCFWYHYLHILPRGSRPASSPTPPLCWPWEGQHFLSLWIAIVVLGWAFAVLHFLPFGLQRDHSPVWVSK